MLLTLTTTHQPATDLGHLLHKHPERVLERALPFGRATVFYPEATITRCTAALLLEVDPVALSRHTRGNESTPLEPYVNDRPYAAGSFLAVALRDAYGTAMTGRSKDRQDLADTPLPLVAELPCVAARGPSDLPERLFGPLGYAVETQPIALDPHFPEWGERPYVRLRVSGTVRLKDLLAHLYVLLPVLDGKKHYYIGDDEVDKLLRHGAGWLETHPGRELILGRFLRFRALVQQAAASFSPEEEGTPEETGLPAQPRPHVHDTRLDRVAKVLKETRAARVLDLGCGEGKLLRRLVEVPQFRDIVGLDVSARALETAADKLRLKARPELAARVRLLHGSLTYPDSRLRGFDAAALVEVIEHLEPHHLETLTENVLGDARPRHLVVTTPNREYNAVFAERGDEARMRHADHRFEWTRAEFRAWAEGAAKQYGYAVRYEDLGDVHPEYGPLTQMAVFRQEG
ncbi:3' terminal RNA ribose 2'-O-methyltransferase Hen1 [Deinococcus hopiensis]|uniref:Small RNA 2'-O-methyltransferase n=1 Tax=Deinococcus hopiensis KR-140 TaxID=695939 RepID=A0A1W1V4X7_9DEIO|nr:3' terminal RNA ribose 2'-O-methyltransferase Hen1 [Deinococcus hopiensis]SMB88386.1 3' terminal RNA ribose 2'-O-methyltransferase Hen1 [Deinococcus hopiensis KR-140]